MNDKLWGARFERPSADIFYNRVNPLSAAMQEAARLGGVLVSHKGEDAKQFTHPVAFECTTEGFDGVRKKRPYRTELHTDRDEPDLLFLAVHQLDKRGGQATSRHDMRDFIITTQGTVQRRDDLSRPGIDVTIQDASDPDYAIVEAALEATDQSLKSHIGQRKGEIWQQKWERQERQRKVKRWLIGSGITAAVISGSAYGIWAWIHHGVTIPNQKADEVRAEYDQIEHTLPGEPIVVGSYPFAIIPQEEFNQIPQYGGSDTDLNQPRIIDVNDGCALLPNTYNSNVELIAALPKESIYSFSEYTASRNTEGEIELCLTEPVLGKDKDDFKLAVQER